jgi:hypothetical protein
MNYKVKDYKLTKIIAPKNTTLDEYYNNHFNSGNSSGLEYFTTDKGKIVQCGIDK